MRVPPDDITLTKLARLAVEAYIDSGVRLKPPESPQGMLSERAASFVTLRTTDGRLRGCIGTIEPGHESLAEEVIENAISAATRDPRFPPVSPAELPDLTYGVDVLSPPEPARGPLDLDPLRFGVTIETLDGTRRGLLLPGISGITTVDEQWRAVHIKAGIKMGEMVRVERFTVRRFGKD
jgi:AmmeMemoRadiSam system protein A